MNTLRTARVLVVDDNPLEAMPILLSLGRVGIGSVYVRGDKMEELPERPLEGIRLVFLDMDLGVGGDAKQKVSTTIAVLGRLLGTEANPTLIVVWTKHKELVDLFQTSVATALPHLRPGLVLPIEKTFDFEDREWPVEVATSGEVDKKVSETIAGAEPLDIIWLWEQLVHDAASKTTASVGNLASARAGDHDPAVAAPGNTRKWLDALTHVLRSLVIAAGRELPDSEHGFADLLEGLGRVHDDRLQREASSQNPSGMQRVFEAAYTGASLDEKAALNTMLLIEPIATTDTVVRPGNVYIARPEAGEKCPFVVLALRADELVQDTLNHPELNAARNELERLLKSSAATDKQRQEARAMFEAKEAEVRAACKVILVELTPTCDVAQNKRQVARFAAGLLVPIELGKHIKKTSDAIFLLDPVMIPELTGKWQIVTNAHYLFGVEDPEAALASKPLCRLRQHVLVAIQGKLAAHAARPGYLSVTK